MNAEVIVVFIPIIFVIIVVSTVVKVVRSLLTKSGKLPEEFFDAVDGEPVAEGEAPPTTPCVPSRPQGRGTLRHTPMPPRKKGEEQHNSHPHAPLFERSGDLKRAVIAAEVLKRKF